MARVLIDIAPLRRHRALRRIWFGQLVSGIGGQLTIVGAAYQIFVLTHSTLMVGLASLVGLVPLLVGSLFGGSLVDSSDRRTVLIVTQLVLCSTSILLALNAGFGHPKVWVIFACGALAAGFQSVDWPARTAIIKMVVPREDLPGASALLSMVSQCATVVGPALVGVLIATIGLKGAFGIDACSFGASLFAVVTLPKLRLKDGGTPPGIQSILEGLRYLRRARFLASTFVVDLSAMVFGMPKAVFPALALDFFHGGAGIVGLLYSAPALGGVIGSMFSGGLNRITHQGRALVVCMSIWGGAIALFGVVPLLGVGLVLLAIAGAADILGVVLRTTVLQMSVPERLQGRLGGVFFASAIAGNRLGDGEAGIAAAVGGSTFAVWSGGLACLAGVAAVIWRFPEILTTKRDDLVATHDAVVDPAGGT